MYRIAHTNGIPVEIYHGDHLIRRIQTSERNGREITEIINLSGTTTTKKTWPKNKKATPQQIQYWVTEKVLGRKL